MSVNSDMAESLRREKARNLRYKKAIHADLNLASIGSKLMEMYESASDVLYWCENDGESTQLDELIGDEEETYELRMAFSTLEGDCQQMLDDLDNEWVPEFFDDFFGGISPRGSMMLGFDSYEGDYFGLDDRYERDLAQKECVKRLMAHTKAEIIEAYAICFRVAINYMALSSRYDGLKWETKTAERINWAEDNKIRIGTREAHPSTSRLVLCGGIGKMIDYHPYIVTSLSGDIVLQAEESCRYPPQVELALLEAGYIVRLHGKKITKTETRKEMRK